MIQTNSRTARRAIRTLVSTPRARRGGRKRNAFSDWIIWPLVAQQAEGMIRVAVLGGGSGPLAGLAVHLAIGTVLGAGYGLLFARGSPGGWCTVSSGGSWAR